MTRPPTLHHITAILGTIDYDALRADIDLHLPGPRTANLEPTRSNGNTDAGEPTPDETRAMQHQAMLEAAVVRAYTALMSIADLQARRIPTHEVKRTTLTAETRGCAWHTQAGVEQHQPVWRNSDCGFLPQPIPLCRACYEFAHAHAEKPTVEQLIRHNRTGKWFQRTNPKKHHFSVDDIVNTAPRKRAS